MLDAAAKALAQMASPPFRAVLLKSVALALVLIVLVGFGVHRLLVWLVGLGEGWAQGALGPSAETPLTVLVWVLSIAASLGVIIGSVMLMPAVTALVASLFADEIAEQVERTHYPADPAGAAVPLARAGWEGAKTALLTVLVYLLALPFLLLAGLGVVILFFANAFLLGREYFELAAMRFHSPADAKALRRQHAAKVFGAGMLIALFVLIPVINLATPLFATALMVHMNKRLSAAQRGGQA
jgi:uncharacterized protein involved in cysteine biosynthesis